MSQVSNQGEQSTSTEIAALAALVALGTSSATQAIQKTGAIAFANVEIGGGGSGVSESLVIAYAIVL